MGMQIKLFSFNPFQVNTYLLINEYRECILIDAGCLDSYECTKLSSYIKENKLSLKRVLNTHLHLDHIFGNKFVFEKYGIKPEAHKADEFLINRFPLMAKNFGINSNTTIEIGNYLNDNDTITLGNIKLTVLHTPGHSPGGVSFYADDDHCLFSGDSLFLGSVGRTDLEGGDFATLKSSIVNKLFSLPKNTLVFPGHGPKTSIDFEKNNNPYLR